MKIKVLVALFLCLICTGMASATLSIKNIESTHGAGYRAVSDTIGINVSSTSNVSLNNVPCSRQGTTQTYICARTDTVNSATATYTVVNGEGQTGTTSIKVDNNVGPINYRIINSKNSVTMEYNVQDLGYGNNNACSGIRTLTVYDGTSMLNTIELNGTRGICTFTGSFNLSIGSSGKKSIILEAKDNVGNIGKSLAQNVTLDIDSPRIINGLMVKYSTTDEELTELSNTASFVVDIYFSISDDNLAGVTLDLSKGNTNPAIQAAYRNLQFSPGNCVTKMGDDGTKVYDCIVRAFPLKISGDSLVMNVTARDIYGNSATSTLSKSFSIDNVVPEVTIYTDRCDSIGNCYIRNGFNNIILKMNKDNFDKGNVFFRLPGSTYDINKVQNCTGTICTARISLTCVSGSMVEISITGFSGFSSQDDAGNPVKPSSTALYCDNTAPLITDMNATGQTSTILPTSVIVSGSTVTITANVLESESEELNVSLWLDTLKNSTEPGECIRGDDYDFNCLWTVTDINPGVNTPNVLLNASDTAGNFNVKGLQFKVFGYRLDNETPHSVGITPGAVNPREINRIVLDMATTNGISYYAYATYSLYKLPEVGSKEVQILHQNVDISKCEYISTQTLSASMFFSEVKVSNEYAGINDVGRLDLRFADNTDPNMLDNTFKIRCNISVIVKEGDYIFKKPQELTLEMPFEIRNSKLCNPGETINVQTGEGACNPGERLGAKIKEIEEKGKIKNEWRGKISDLIPKLQKICSMRNYVGEAATAAQVVSMVANGISIGTGDTKLAGLAIQFSGRMFGLDACLAGTMSKNPGNVDFFNNYASSAVSSVGSTGSINLGNAQDMKQGLMDYAATSIIDKNKMADTCSKLAGKACDYLLCTNTKAATDVADSVLKDEGQKSQGYPDIFGKDTNFFDESRGILNKRLGYGFPDVGDSMIMAFTTQCWPAVYYNFEKWRQVDCNYLYCLKMAAYTGMDVSTCDQARYSQSCMYIVGELFEVVPGVNTAIDFMENAADYAGNFLPLAASSLMNRALCPDYVSADPNVLKAGKINVPQDIPRQTFMIYACQLPLTLARWTDIKARSGTRGNENFVYPQIPDMCVYAKCIGEEDCQYEPDFWETVNKIRIPNNSTLFSGSMNGNVNAAMAETNVLTGDLKELGRKERTIAMLETQIEELGDAKDDTPQEKLRRDNLNSQILLQDKERQTLITSLQEQGLLKDYKNDDEIADFLRTNANMNTYISASDKKDYEQIQTEKLEFYNEFFNKYPGYTPEEYLRAIGSTIDYATKLANGETEESLNYPNMDENMIADARKLGELMARENNMYEKTAEHYNSEVIKKNQNAVNEYLRCLADAKNKGTVANCDFSMMAQGNSLTESQMSDLTVLSDKVAYGALTIDEKLRLNNLKAGFLSTAQTYNTILSTSFSYDDNDAVPGMNGKTYAGLKSEYVQILRNLNLCDGAGQPPCDASKLDGFYSTTSKDMAAYTKILNGESAKTTKDVEDLKRALNAYKGGEALGDALYMGLQYADSQNMLRFFNIGEWTTKWFGVDVVDAIDPDKWAESWCNRVNQPRLDGASDESMVISCDSGRCQPVLSYAAERTMLSYTNYTTNTTSTYYIYTIVYYISAGDLRGLNPDFSNKNITYNVYIRGNGPEIKGYYKGDPQLKAFEIVQKKDVFMSTEVYDEICIQFSERFPLGNSLTNARTYCRAIEENVFDTGAPWSPEEQDEVGEGIAVYNSLGKRVETTETGGTGNANTQQIGIFE